MNSSVNFPSLFEIAPVALLVIGGLWSMLRATAPSGKFPVVILSSLFFLPAIFWQWMLYSSDCKHGVTGFFANQAIVLFAQLVLLIIAYLSTLNFSEVKYQVKLGLGEKVALIFFATSGGYVLLASQNLLTWYLSLEILAISSYALVGANLSSKASTEAAIKYLIQGALGSCLILFSFATLYGVTASLDFEVIRTLLLKADRPVVLLSLGFWIMGLSLKLGLVPFHYWVADVYQSAESATTNYLAGVVKFAVAVASFLLISEVFIDLIGSFNKLFWLIIVLSIIVGNLLAIVQKDAKRMLAYSAIAHTAYFSIGFLEPKLELFQQAFYAYLVFYTILSLLTFTILDLLEEESSVPLKHLEGLIYRSPLIGTVFILVMLSLAGLPPIFFALLAKVFVLKALLSAGYLGLACVILLGTVLGCYYYFKLITIAITRTEESLVSPLYVTKTKAISVFVLVFTLFYYTAFPSRIFDYLLSII